MWHGEQPAFQYAATSVRASALAFGLFVVANAALYLRPADLIDRQDLPIYLVLVVGCLLVSYRSVISQLTTASLASRPITVCLLVLFGTVVASHASSLNLDSAGTSAFNFSKQIAYYLVLVGVVDSVQRLRRFIGWFVLFVFGITVLGLLQYYEMIDLQSVASLAERQVDPEQSDPELLLRLCSVGVFNNPNDLARILLIAMPLALFGMVHATSRVWRLFGALAFALFVYALVLTYSRGGLLGFCTGAGMLFLTRYGWRKTFFAAAVSIPIMLVVLQARRSGLSIGEGTGQHRVLIWSDGLGALRDSPLFGIGYDEYARQFGGMAHNSFVQCFVELGVIGGSFFVASFYVPARAWLCVPLKGADLLGHDLGRMLPYLLAIFAGYGVSLFSSSRHHVEQTYLVFGLATIYFHLAGQRLRRQNSWVINQHSVGRRTASAIRFATSFNARLVFQVLALGIASLIVLDIVIRRYAQYGYKD
jgi:O-antigen ligase